MDANVVKVLKENSWSLATFSDMPNVVPVGFKDVLEDGTLVVGGHHDGDHRGQRQGQREDRPVRLRPQDL